MEKAVSGWAGAEVLVWCWGMLLFGGNSAAVVASETIVVRSMIAVDIDETISQTDYSAVLWGVGKDKSKPLPHAQAALQRLSKRFDILYVTARPRSIRSKTQQWLDRYDFPKGRLVTSAKLNEFVFQSNYKRSVLGRLRREYPNLVIGIGDKASDAKAYRGARMLPIVVHPWPTHKYRTDDVVLQNWQAVLDYFGANMAFLSNPQQMNHWLNQEFNDGNAEAARQPKTLNHRSRSLD